MDRVPWPIVLTAGIIGGAVGTIALAYVIAASKIESALTR